MTISKTLRDYIENTIHNKAAKHNQEKFEEDQKIFDTIRDELSSIQSKAMERCISIIESKGLDPEDFGYYPYSPLRSISPKPYMRVERARYKNVSTIIQDILIKIELDEIPKKEIKEYVDNFDVSKFLEND